MLLLKFERSSSLSLGLPVRGGVDWQVQALADLCRAKITMIVKL
jgi:hypothetical protein